MHPKTARMIKLLATPEPHFLLPGAAPIIVGSALGFAVTGTFNPLLAILAFISIVALNAGSNMINDYYDHLSGNDWQNDNVTPFGGGSRYIQNGIVTPKAMLIAGLTSLTIGICVGLIILAITKSMVILILGILGVMGGFFWTAPPIKICYRFIGEPHIFTVFGILPVYGAYYLQTASLDLTPLIPASILGLVIAMLAEINSIPDRFADAAVNKKTFVVRYGVKAGITFYRVSILTTYLLAFIALFISPVLKFGAGAYLLTLPLAIFALKTANYKNLTTRGHTLANRLTIILHSACALSQGAGFLAFYFCR